MNGNGESGFSRRRVLQAGMAAGIAVAAGEAFGADAKPLAPILRGIPSTGEKLPVVGVGTNAFGVTSADELAELKRVLQALPEEGGKVIDTARAYGSSELVIGKLLADLGNRDKVFLATKTPMVGVTMVDAKAALDESFRRLQVSKLDLLQIHNVSGADELLPAMLEYKAAGKIRYVGVTTSIERQYDQLLGVLKNNKLDFVQVNYSIGDRNAADRVLSFAQDKGLAVLINTPFGGRGRSYFPRVANVPVPEWAKEFDATTWAQFFLKYIVSHPAVTAAIPGTTAMSFLADNQAGGRGRLPTPALRKKMEEFWDALPS